LKQWINAYPDEQDDFADFSNQWINEHSGTHVPDEIIDANWQSFYKNHVEPEINDQPLKIKRDWLMNFRQMAAVFVLGAILSMSLFMAYTWIKPDDITVQTIKVPNGAQSDITLPDGSKVRLNSGSTISYASNYNDEVREVKLLGEAFFVVEKNPQKPFVVNTKALDVKAYGTEFIVTAYGDEPVVEATLLEGVISVQSKNEISANSKEIYLKPNQRMIYTLPKEGINVNASEGNGKYLLYKNIDSKGITAWLNNELYLKNEPLTNLVKRLERKYNVLIQLNDESMKELKFSGLLKDQTIEQVLLALKLTSSIDYKIKNREVWLFKKQ
jgi:ferric-dicitrate binding protein FerR (iron transport regulator)